MRTASLALVVLLAPAARAADVTDPADLFPPDTAAYAELHDPAAVAPELLAAVKGSSLEDSLRAVHERRDAARELTDLQGKQGLAILGLFASPEMAGEFRKLRGVAVGLTGFTEGGQPKGAVAVLTGDSQAAGLAARAFLTISSDLRKVGTVGAANTPVYQYRTPAVEFDPMTGRQKLSDKPFTDGPHEPTFAYVPGLFVMGTSKAAVGDVVTRFLGETRTGLSGNPAFRAAAAAHRKPGVFFYADVRGVCTRFEAATKGTDGVAESDALAWLRLVANDKAVKSVAGNVRFRDRGLVLTVAAGTDPAAASPLVRFLGGTGAKAAWLHAAPHPAAVAVAVSFPQTDRAAAVVGFLDAVAKATGTLGRLPSDVVHEIETKHKVAVTDRLIAKTRGATVVVPVELPATGAPVVPMIVFHCETPEAAAGWEEFIPKLAGELAGANPPQPSTETIGTVKVFSLAGANLPWKAAVHYARKETTVAVGLDRKRVAAAAEGDAAGSVVGGEQPAVIPTGNDYALVGSVAAGPLLRLLAHADQPTGPVRPLPPGGTGVPPGGIVPVPQEPPVAGAGGAKGSDALLAALDGLPPATVTARVAAGELRVEVVLPRVQGGAGPVINAAVKWFDSQWNPGPYQGGYPTMPGRGFRRGF